MSRIKLVAVLVIALGGFTLNSPQAFGSEQIAACCTSGDGKHRCCGESCSATEDSCSAKCTKNPLDCLKEM